MCDYSQHLSVRDFCTRRAKVGDELELLNLAHSVFGFIKWNEGEGYKPGKSWRGRGVVTCLRPGTEIVFERRWVIPTSRSNITLESGEVFNVADIVPDVVARTGSVRPFGYGLTSDVIEFPNGLQLGLAGVPLFMRVKVLQLPVVKRRKSVKAKAKIDVAERARSARRDYEEFVEAHR